MDKFNRNDRVRYIGTNWLERKGWLGVVTGVIVKHDRGTGGYFSVKFDNYESEVRCYGSSLEKIYKLNENDHP